MSASSWLRSAVLNRARRPPWAVRLVVYWLKLSGASAVPAPLKFVMVVAAD